MRIAWMLGWAIPERWFASVVDRAAFPAEHVYFAAHADAVARLETAGPFDHVVGYSLGALLLLGESARVGPLGRVSLLAPIFAFAAEENLGGRASRTQVRHLARWLRREPAAALADFYSRAGLDISASEAPAQAAAELQWGLERLATDRVAPPMPPAWSACVGAEDALLDAARLQTLDPKIRVIPGATHHPAGLIAGWAQEVRR